MWGFLEIRSAIIQIPILCVNLHSFTFHSILSVFCIYLAIIFFQVRLENIGAEDIVDGKERLILGLIWTIILRFQIQDIEIQLVSSNRKRHLII